MLFSKPNLVIGITTFNNEMLSLSIPTLLKLNKKFLLIIHNDNPMTTLSKKQIRQIGYHGQLHIINSTETVGLFKSRMAIIKHVKTLTTIPEWIIFSDDDDIITDVSIPNVSSEIFAIIQNSAIIRHRLLDLLKIIKSPKDVDIDAENVVVSKPNMGFAGTLIRTNTVIRFYDFLLPITDSIKQISDALDYRAPEDIMMWHLLNMYTKSFHPNITPIYMDKLNYIKIALDTSNVKYNKLNKPVRNVQEHYKKALLKYENLMQTTIDAFALRG